MSDVTTIDLDYPIRPRSRYGWGAALERHEPIDAILAGNVARIEQRLDDILRVVDDLAAIPATADEDDPTPRWSNSWLPSLDGAALYAFVAARAPVTYLEVGSGNSTKFVHRAISDHDLSTRIVSIDPQPRADIDAICDEVIRHPLEDADLSVFDELGPDDIVFVDNSHRSFQNSDATVVFLDVVPALPAGVLLGIHDIFLPLDYPPEWGTRFYSEQYLLAAFLLGGHRGYHIELPALWVSQHPAMAQRLAPLWARDSLRDAERHGGAFWMSRYTDETSGDCPSEDRKTP
jgi:hypothetical protein